jgi:AraC-like DNA-binding protein
MLIHVMRAWLRMQQDDATDGWLLALRDPVIARAMNAIHQRPRQPWTIESLAREVSVSRATLARRFAHLVGETPPEYLTRWRMDLAAQRLRDTDDTVAGIAAAVGYRSEYSFSRAFTRHRGLAPGPLSAPYPRTIARGRIEARRGRKSDDVPERSTEQGRSGLRPAPAASALLLSRQRRHFAAAIDRRATRGKRASEVGLTLRGRAGAARCSRSARWGFWPAGPA